MNELPYTHYTTFTDMSLEINPEKIKKLNNDYTIFYDQFIAISLLTNSSKLAIDNNLNVCVQNWRPWRFLLRKIKRQSTLLSLIFIDQQIDEYIIFINDILELRDKLMDTFVTLLHSNYSLIKAILPNLKYLRNSYNLKGATYKDHSRYLESICNRLNVIQKTIVETISNVNYLIKNQ